MKKLIFLISLCCFTLTISAQGIQFTTGNWASVLQKAKAQNKLVFIDVFTSWCGPCKHMAKETFTKKSVGDFYNSHFINYRVDAEKGEGITIAKKYGVHAYPTCMYITSNGEVAYKFLGSKDTIEIMEEANNALKYKTLMPKIKQMKATYAQGNRTKSFLKEYVSAMKESGEDAGTALTDYLKLMTDAELYSKEGYKYIKAITTFDQSLFNRIHKHYEEVCGVDSLKKEVKSSFMSAIGNTLENMMKPNNAKYVTSFEQLLPIKEDMTKEKDVLGAMFGGMGYRPSNELRISFYSNANTAKFKELMNAYMDQEIKSQKADSTQNMMSSLRKNTKEKMDSLMIINDTVMYKKVKNSYNLVSIIMNAQYESTADFILGQTEKYWDVTQKTETEKQKCIKWALEAYKYNSGLSITESCATFLNKLGQTDKAKQILKEAIELAKEDTTGEIKPEAIKKAETQLNGL
jgi:thiol-disulfide isomerase/thioredoxin